jgi:uncharacterized protein (DUF1810 family)
MAEDPFDLRRFVDAQAPVYARVLRELAAGEKRTHWMWFVFPQISGLGHSAMARRFALGSLGEAKAYLAHPLLGPRLAVCTTTLLGLEGRTAEQIFGPPDDLKFRSSMTLFARAAEADAPYRAALAKYFGGADDPLTLELIGH